MNSKNNVSGKGTDKGEKDNDGTITGHATHDPQLSDVRLGVYLCECGTNIAATVDVDALLREVRDIPGVKVARKSRFTCATAGQESIKKDIRKNDLTGVVIASCSPKMHGKTFATTVSAAGLNPYKLQIVNLREHCSWVHNDRRSATEKAVSLVRGGIRRAADLQSLESGKASVSRDVLVVGGGVAGITSALQLADSGFRVTLAERSPSIGGNMAKLSKTFPTLDCSPCILSPRMVDVALHPDIELLTDTELVSLEGSVGNFAATLHRKPRGVNAELCISCAICTGKCPVSVPAEFEEGLYERAAIYKLFDQAVPSHYAIDFDNCEKCGNCVKVCPRDAIDLEDEGDRITRKVGAVITATGFSLMEMEGRYTELLSGHPAVISAMQLERFMIQEGAAGEVLKRKDGRRIKNVAFVLCAGSRDPHRGVEDCSKICCTYATKLATLLKKTYRYMKISVHYIDVRTGTKGCEEFFCTAQGNYGIDYIRGKVAEIIPGNFNDHLKGGIVLRYEDTLAGESIEQQVDLAVLCTAMTPDADLEELAGRLGVPLGPDGYIAEKHPKLDPVATHKGGIFAAGCVLGPRDIHDSVTDGKSAAAQVMQLLGRGEIELSPIKATIDRPGDCTSCGLCVKVCPESAITMNIKTARTTRPPVPEVNTMLCVGCGACAGVCPDGVIDIAGSTEAQLLAEIDGILSPVSDPGDSSADTARKGKSPTVIVGFFGDALSYIAADSAGTARMQYSTALRIIDVPTTMRMAPRHVLYALANGADGVLLSDEKGGHEEELTLDTLERTKGILQEKGVDPRRVEFMPMLLPTFKTIPKIVDDFVAAVGRMDELTEEKRKSLIVE